MEHESLPSGGTATKSLDVSPAGQWSDRRTELYASPVPLALGVLASLLIGVSDTFGRVSSRRADSVSHVGTQMLTGAVISVPVALLLGSSLIGRDLLSGAVSGVFIAGGLAVVYRGMALSSAAIVAPAAAVLAALVPLLWDVAGGTNLKALEVVGCGVALTALVLTTFNPDLGDRVREGLVLALAGGLLFGLSIVCAADTSEASGAWPAVSQRATGFVAMTGLAMRRNVPALLPGGLRKFGIGGGIAGVGGMIAWIIGGQQGDLGTVSVVSSTYPAVVAVLATRFDDDQIRWWQAIGIGGAIGGSILIAIA